MSEQEVFDALKYRVEVDEHGCSRYYNAANQLHRDGGPAVGYEDGHKEWYQNGQLHRENGPAIEWTSGARSWWQNGRRHRTDGPAIEYHDGTKEWYINGKPMTEAEFLAATQPAIEMTVADVEKLLGKRVKIIK